MKKMTYKCSNSDCKHFVTPQWGKYLEFGCNYTITVKEAILDLGLICNVSYEKISKNHLLDSGSSNKQRNSI